MASARFCKKGQLVFKLVDDLGGRVVFESSLSRAASNIQFNLYACMKYGQAKIHIQAAVAKLEGDRALKLLMPVDVAACVFPYAPAMPAFNLARFQSECWLKHGLVNSWFALW